MLRPLFFSFLFTCKPLNDTRCKTLVGQCGRMAMSWYLGTARSRPSLALNHHLDRVLYEQAQGTTNLKMVALCNGLSRSIMCPHAQRSPGLKG